MNMVVDLHVQSLVGTLKISKRCMVIKDARVYVRVSEQIPSVFLLLCVFFCFDFFFSFLFCILFCFVFFLL